MPEAKPVQAPVLNNIFKNNYTSVLYFAELFTFMFRFSLLKVVVCFIWSPVVITAREMSEREEGEQGDM